MNSIAQRVLIVSLVVTCLQVVTAGDRPATARGCEDRGAAAVTPESGAVFNDPAGEAADEYRIIGTTRNNIAGTPAGAVIRIATLKITTASTVKALTRAHTCGVHVRVLVPGRAWQDPAVVKLRQELGSDTSRKSWITSCDGTCTTAGSQGIMHAKVQLFSKVVDAEDVTIYSSGNFVHSQATGRYNDAYQVVGDPDVYASAREYFGKLVLNEVTAYARMTSSPGFRQYYFPAANNFHRDVFKHTRCRTDDGRTTIDFAASIWKRRDVVKTLADQQDAGCAIRVIVSLAKADRDVLEGLYHHEIPTHVQSLAEGDLATHSKYIAIRGSHRGRQVETVYCGSLNVSKFSARVADNTMLRVVDDPAAYGAYQQNFDVLWNQSRPLRRSDVRSATRIDAAAAEAQT